MKLSELLVEIRYHTKKDTVVSYIEEFNIRQQPYGNLNLIGMDITALPAQIIDMPSGALDVSHNNLTSFDNFPKVAQSINAMDNKFKSLHNIHKHIHKASAAFGLDLTNNPIESSVLGLLLIQELPSVAFDNFKGDTKLNRTLDAVNTIINKYLPNRRGNDAVMECQNELIDAGYEEYAQL